MGAGKVDTANLWKNEEERRRRIRWRTLRMVTTGAVVAIYGYACRPEGPWFGYTLVDLKDAPCVHCGRTGVFLPTSWTHDCSGFYEGKRLPCAEGVRKPDAIHPCRGEPSMSYGGVPFWRSTDWVEVEIVSK